MLNSNNMKKIVIFSGIVLSFSLLFTNFCSSSFCDVERQKKKCLIVFRLFSRLFCCCCCRLPVFITANFHSFLLCVTEKDNFMFLLFFCFSGLLFRWIL